MSASAVHVGLNLIFLVPGETGGMEVYAHELIPALLAEAPAEMRFTAFVNREVAAAGGGPWGELLPAVTVPVKARNRLREKGMRVLVPRAARRSDRVIADSKSTREDLMELLRVPSDHIDVVP